MKITRRECLTTAAGAILAASVLPTLADNDQGHGPDGPETLYGHGMVWNRDLPGVAGDVKLSFDLRVNQETGTGFGTGGDPVHPDWNIHFAINSTQQRESRFALTGVVTRANNPANVGVPVRILAETRGDATTVGIELGNLVFSGAGAVRKFTLTFSVERFDLLFKETSG